MTTTDLCVIFNPAAGRRQAQRRLARLRRRWGSRVEFRATDRAGHAEELALAAAREGFRVVAAAGGDGTVHEVANGLLRAGRPEVLFGVVPVGSANDYAYSLGVREADGVVQGPAAGGRAVDVGVVSDAAGRQRFFVNSLGLGLSGAVTVESRRIRRLQGLALYGLATLRALWYHYACPVMHFTIDGADWQAPTLMVSVGLGQREGGFVLAPQAELDDGWFEFLHAGDLSRWEVLRFLPRLATAGPPTDHPKVRIARCREIAISSGGPLTIHIDGEFFCRPEDGVRSVYIKILPGALRVCGLMGEKL
jgi:YegS/Rv2252/BmrU family lipid kinase